MIKGARSVLRPTTVSSYFCTYPQSLVNFGVLAQDQSSQQLPKPALSGHFSQRQAKAGSDENPKIRNFSTGIEVYFEDVFGA